MKMRIRGEHKQIAVDTIQESAEALRSKGVEVDVYFDFSKYGAVKNCIISFKPKDRFRFCYSCSSTNVKRMASMLKDMVAMCENGKYKYVRSSGMNSALKNNVLWQM
jgi:hypothetical protein